MIEIIIIVIGQLLIAGIFLFAAGTKLIDRTGLRKTIIDFGLPQGTAKYLVYGIPILEVSFSVMLLTNFYAWWGAIGILLLLLSFLTAMIINITYRKARPPCHCFGEVHSQPIGMRTLIRNGILIGVTLSIVIQGPFVLQRTLSEVFATAFSFYEVALPSVILIIIIMALVAMTSIFYQQNRRLSSKLEDLKQTGSGLLSTAYSPSQSYAGQDLPMGSRAPNFTLVDINGATRTLHSFIKLGKPVLLLFISPTCEPCNNLFPLIRKWQMKYADELTSVIVSGGTTEQNRDKIAQYNLTNLLVQKNREVSDLYNVHVTPSALVVNVTGKIKSPLAAGSEQISSLVSSIIGSYKTTLSSYSYLDRIKTAQDLLPGALAQIGQKLPSIWLHEKSGQKFNLQELNMNKPMAVIFWSPYCVSCPELLSLLIEWNNRTSHDVNRIQLVLVVSTDNVKVLKELGELEPIRIFLDNDFSAGRALGIHGTPAAVLVDSEKKISSNIATDKAAILELLGIDSHDIHALQIRPEIDTLYKNSKMEENAI